eukprot:TRINITY_DN8549_c0_g1_i2.p1 TRINITY_DN8549_c0_g1~~TRINITY_DN8549_c0_g1_i2.p1  ORF type:complete len:323 (-),score=41.40 TRINITY_DN8549_c0_g1_i2:11-916(-)
MCIRDRTSVEHDPKVLIREKKRLAIISPSLAAELSHETNSPKVAESDSYFVTRSNQAIHSRALRYIQKGAKGSLRERNKRAVNGSLELSNGDEPSIARSNIERCHSPNRELRLHADDPANNIIINKSAIHTTSSYMTTEPSHFVPTSKDQGSNSPQLIAGGEHGHNVMIRTGVERNMRITFRKVFRREKEKRARLNSPQKIAQGNTLSESNPDEGYGVDPVITSSARIRLQQTLDNHQGGSPRSALIKGKTAAHEKMVEIVEGSKGLYGWDVKHAGGSMDCLLYTSPSPRDGLLSRMPSSA